MRYRKLLGLFLFFGVLVLTACGNSEAQNTSEGSEEAFFADESIEMLVPFSPGGGADTTARFSSTYFSQYLEGSPSIQVQNQPGGGGILGLNEYENFKEHDGTNTAWTSASTHLAYFLNQPGIEFSFNDFTPLLGFPSGAIVYVSSDVEYEEPKDILNLEEDLVYAGISATGADLLSLIAFELLDLDVDTVLGYEGGGDTRVAFMQGESNINIDTTPGYITNTQELEEQGEVIPLFTTGVLDAEGNINSDPEFPDLPTIEEFYEEIHGEKPSGVTWDAYKQSLGVAFSIQRALWVHNDAPSAAIEELQKASERLTEDEEFIAENEKQLGKYPLSTGDDLQAMVDNSFAGEDDTAALEWIHEFLESEYDVTLE